MKLLGLSFMTALTLTLVPAGHAGADVAKRPDTVTLARTVALDPQGRLLAAPGRYRKVREDRSGAYYRADDALGAGALVGVYRAKITPSPAKGVFIPPLKKIHYLLVLADGVTVCGADENFIRMVCTPTNALTSDGEQAG